MKHITPRLHSAFWVGYEQDSRVSTQELLAEFIDNSIDSGARNIDLRFDSDAQRFAIEDDGMGCADMSRFIDLGDSGTGRRKAGGLGRYGTGGTKAAAALCRNQQLVESTTEDGITRTLFVDWKALKSGAAETAETDHGAAPTGSRPGTRIELHGITRKHFFAPPTIERYRRHFSFIYGPAIAQGVNVWVQGERLGAAHMPILKSVRAHKGELNGKRWEGYFGILREEDLDSWDPGFYVALRGRVITHRPIWDGAEAYVGSNFFGMIELIEPPGCPRWDLDLHKTDFSEREELCEESIVPLVEDLLAQAQDEGRDLRIRTLDELHSSTLTAALGLEEIKERRPGKGGAEGTVEPTGRHGKRTNATNADELETGSVVHRKGDNKRIGRWRTHLKPLGENGPLMKCHIGGGVYSITFNSSIEYVASVIYENNDLVAACAIVEVANAIQRSPDILTREFRRRVGAGVDALEMQENAAMILAASYWREYMDKRPTHTRSAA